MAYEALLAGRCLYAGTSSVCSDHVTSRGLRNDDDTSAVLVCRAHYGRLRRIREPDLNRLEDYLLTAFGKRTAA